MRGTKPISISEFRSSLFRVFELFKDGGDIRVTYRRKVYIFSIRPTNDKISTPYRRSLSNHRNKIDPNSIESTKCEACGDLEQFGVCMNVKCTTNRPMSENEAIAA